MCSGASILRSLNFVKSYCLNLFAQDLPSCSSFGLGRPPRTNSHARDAATDVLLAFYGQRHYVHRPDFSTLRQEPGSTHQALEPDEVIPGNHALGISRDGSLGSAAPFQAWTSIHLGNDGSFQQVDSGCGDEEDYGRHGSGRVLTHIWMPSVPDLKSVQNRLHRNWYHSKRIVQLNNAVKTKMESQDSFARYSKNIVPNKGAIAATKRAKQVALRVTQALFEFFLSF